MASLRNPFLYGNPVPPDSFFGRSVSVDTVYARLNNGESTAIVGDPHVGKTSLLSFVADEKVKRRKLDTPHKHLFIEISCLSLALEMKPNDLWMDVISEIEPFFSGNPTLLRHVEVLRQNNFGSWTLERFFTQFKREGFRLVLLLDEFDVLLNHPNFNTAEFFGTLRTIAANIGGLVLIIASRLGIAEINRRTFQINPIGSPFLNNFATERLYPLTRPEVDLLIDHMLGDSPIRFGRDDRAFIYRVAGGHPYLVQAACAALFQQDAAGIYGDTRYTNASRRFYDAIEHHFSDLWLNLDSMAQATMVLLALGELEGKLQGRDFNIHDLQKLDWYEPELRKLQESGIVEMEEATRWDDGADHFVTSGGHRWRVAAASFLWWVTLDLLPRTRNGQPFEKWIHDREYEGVFTNKTRDKLIELRQHIPAQFTELSWKLIKAFISSHTGLST